MTAEARLRAVLGDAPFELMRRERCWLALGTDVIAFAVFDDAAWQRLAIEAWLLDRWRGAGIPVPRVIRTDDTHRVQVRERMQGLSGHDIHSETSASPLYPAELPDVDARLADAPLSPFGEQLAASYGDLAARMHRAVSVADARTAGLDIALPRKLDVDDAIARLPPDIAEHAMRARDWLVDLPAPDAVVHADLHFFNLCVDARGSITGVFDVGDAGLDNSAVDLMYVHSLGSRFARIAMSAYGPIDEADVRRAHLRTALDHVINHGPGTPRHESIIAWTRAAFARLS